MKKAFFKLSFAFFALLSLSACNKNSNGQSRTELLTQKPWFQTNVEKGTAGNWKTDDDFTAMEACEKDDQTIFRVNKVYEVNEGASKCDASEEQIKEQGSWELKDDETKLTISGETGTIEKLDESTLIVTYSATQNGGLNYRFTLKH